MGFMHEPSSISNDLSSRSTGAGKLIPPPELAPGPPANASPAQCIALWFDLLDFTDSLFLGRLRASGKSEEEVQAAYRTSYAQWVAEHDRKIERMLTRSPTRSATDGG